MNNYTAHHVHSYFRCIHRGSTRPAEHFLRIKSPPKMAAVNFVLITNVSLMDAGIWNSYSSQKQTTPRTTGRYSVDQPIACYVLSFRELRLVVHWVRSSFAKTLV